MNKVMFVCLGNICRSPMAEFILKDIVKKRGIENKFIISSCATSNEEIGNEIHYSTRKKLEEQGIYCQGKTAVRFKIDDYNKYDYILTMETKNTLDLLKIVGNDKDKKILRLLDFSDNPRDIADPWYSGNFDVTYNDILEGCNFFLQKMGF